jgi:hypothetical protein
MRRRPGSGGKGEMTETSTETNSTSSFQNLLYAFWLIYRADQAIKELKQTIKELEPLNNHDEVQNAVNGDEN